MKPVPAAKYRPMAPPPKGKAKKLPTKPGAPC